MENKDVLLLAIDAGGGMVTPVQLQKSVFLIGEEGLPGIPSPLYTFEPYHYGPFDTKVYSDANELHEQGFVLRMPSVNGAWTETMITRNGKARADRLREELPTNTLSKITEIAQHVQSLSFRDLLQYVYKKHPEFRKNSVFQF